MFFPEAPGEQRGAERTPRAVCWGYVQAACALSQTGVAPQPGLSRRLARGGYGGRGQNLDRVVPWAAKGLLRRVLFVLEGTCPAPGPGLRLHHSHLGLGRAS